jgi:FixJ family two-component response regulator
VLTLSGRSDISSAVEAIRNGASDFIEKRLDVGIILNRVERRLAGGNVVDKMTICPKGRFRHFPTMTS